MLLSSTSAETDKNCIKPCKIKQIEDRSILQHEKSPCCSETVQRPSGIDQRAFFRRSSATFFFFNWHAACFTGSRVCSGGLFESPPGVPDFQWDRLAPIPLLLNSLLTQGPRSGCFYGSSEGLKESSSKLTSIASSTARLLAAVSIAPSFFASCPKIRRSKQTPAIDFHNRYLQPHSHHVGNA